MQGKLFFENFCNRPTNLLRLRGCFPLVEGQTVPKKRELSPQRSEVELSVPWVVDGQHRLCSHDGQAVETFIQERSLVHKEYMPSRADEATRVRSFCVSPGGSDSDSPDCSRRPGGSLANDERRFGVVRGRRLGIHQNSDYGFKAENSCPETVGHGLLRVDQPSAFAATRV